jgi:N-ethylmaleimide reductase
LQTEIEMTKLFKPYDLAGLPLRNRIVMAPMTRARAANNTPDAATALYYRQRASAGLIITEGAPISEEGRGYLFTPGIYNSEQVTGWRRVTDEVHEVGGKIFIQLWHVGRVSHTSLQPQSNKPVSSSVIRATTSHAFAYNEKGEPGNVPTSEPQALSLLQIKRVTADFVRAARLAMDAKFDGVEIHGANGYLFEQFINSSANDRTDEYGGSIDNRLRFLLETVDAMTSAIGGKHVGVRISPFGRLSDMTSFPDEAETWLALAQEFSERTLAYVHLSDQLTLGATRIPAGFPQTFRQNFTGTLMAAGGFNKETGEAALQSGELDLVAIGRPFIANPDLVERFKNDWPLTADDKASYYGLTERGYTDFQPYAKVMA